jgi:cytochrome oxidase Cu insertion factor (SCO1/SenC/PrrC family)
VNQVPAERSRQRRTLALIAVLFLLPVAASFYLYYVRTDWRPAGTTNHGELIEPPRTLPSVTLRSSDGSAIELPFEKGWSLIYVGDGDCDARCREALYVMRQVRLALNRDSDRVQRIFLYRGDCCDVSYFSQHEGLMKLDLDTDVGGRLMRAFPSQGVHPAESGLIWLADPHGNLIMSYTSATDPKGMLEDLKRLLKLSHIG